MDLHPVDVTILGNISGVRGLAWPVDGRGERALSARLDQDCDVRVHLPGGKTLAIGTRPILVLTRPIGADVVIEATLPPLAPPGTLQEKVSEMERLLKDWGAVPSPHMRAMMDEVRQYPPTSFELGSFLRIGSADLGGNSEVLFELSADPEGRYVVVALVSATTDELQRIRNESHARALSAVPCTAPTPAQRR